jgi:hypothetical protein
MINDAEATTGGQHTETIQMRLPLLLLLISAKHKQDPLATSHGAAGHES